MKRVLALIISAVVALGLIGCGNSDDSSRKEKKTTIRTKDYSYNSESVEQTEKDSIIDNNSLNNIEPMINSVEFHQNLALATYKHKHAIAIICADGTVKTQGDNTFGQLGIGDTNQHSGWCNINLSNIRQIIGVTTYFLAVNDSGELFIFGGLNLTPKRIPFEKRIERIICSYDITGEIKNYVIETKDKTNYKLSFEEYKYRLYNPTFEIIENYIQTDERKSDNATEKYNTSTLGDYYFILYENGNLMTGGNNEYGQLGDGTTYNSRTYLTILNNIKDFVYDNDETAYALSYDNELYAWGYEFSPTPKVIVSMQDFYE